MMKENSDFSVKEISAADCKFPPIIGENVLIRQMELSDAAAMQKNVTRDVVRWTMNIPYPYTLKAAEGFIRKSQKEIKIGKAYHLGIFLKETGEHMGTICLAKVNQTEKNAETGYWLSKRFWGKGYMTEAVGLMLDFGFRKLKLHRIYASLFAENKASEKVLIKSGFKKEGVLKESRFRYGKWHDTFLYGMIKREYKCGEKR